MSRLLLVTGATGKLGRPLVAALTARGDSVRALVRDPARADLPGVEVVRGALDDDGALARAVAGASGVLHLAAHVEEGDPADHALMDRLRRVNVEGSVALARAAAAAGVARFLFVSSYAVYGLAGGAALTADARPTPATAYGLSKWEAEQALGALVAGTAMELVIARPVVVASGPGPRHDILSEMVALARRGLFPLPAAARRARKSLIALSDCVAGLIAVLDRGRPSRAYVLSAPRGYALEEIVGTIARATGRRTSVPVPLSALSAAAWLSDRVLAPLGLPAPVSSRRVAKLLRDQAFDVTATDTEIGFEARVTELSDLLAPYLASSR